VRWDCFIQDVHKLFEGVHNFYLRREYLYIKKKKKKIPLIFQKVRVCNCTPSLQCSAAPRQVACHGFRRRAFLAWGTVGRRGKVKGSLSVWRGGKLRAACGSEVWRGGIATARFIMEVFEIFLIWE
jgi:hypothetical protein